MPPLECLRTSPAGASNLAVPVGGIVDVSDPLFTDTVVDADTVGVKATITFLRQRPAAQTIRSPLLVRVPWQVTAAAAAGALGRLNARLRRNGNNLVPAALVIGTIRSLAAIAGPFVEVLAIPLPGDIGVGPADTIQVDIEIEVTTLAVGADATVRLLHDPATAANRLILDGIE